MQRRRSNIDAVDERETGVERGIFGDIVKGDRNIDRLRREQARFVQARRRKTKANPNRNVKAEIESIVIPIECNSRLAHSTRRSRHAAREHDAENRRSQRPHIAQQRSIC